MDEWNGLGNQAVNAKTIESFKRSNKYIYGWG